jgi:3-phosphoglycerate kinase
VLAVVGIALIALGVVLTLARVVGDVVPTVLAIAGMVSLVAGIATGSLLVLENFRYSRNQSYYDDDEDE